ncbi:unnamed protein product [Urochloa humidicola]
MPLQKQQRCGAADASSSGGVPSSKHRHRAKGVTGSISGGVSQKQQRATGFLMKLAVSVKLPDDPLKLKLQYFHENATFATVVCMKPSPVVEFSGTVGIKGLALGAECRYDAGRKKFRKYRAAIGMTSKYYDAALIMADKGDTIKVYGMYHFDKKQKASAVVELTRKLSKNENALTVGGLYTVDAHTTVKARLNNTGSLAALLRLEVKPKSHLMISGEFDMKALDKPPKIGLALALIP